MNTYNEKQFFNECVNNKKGVLDTLKAIENITTIICNGDLDYVNIKNDFNLSTYIQKYLEEKHEKTIEDFYIYLQCLKTILFHDGVNEHRVIMELEKELNGIESKKEDKKYK